MRKSLRNPEGLDLKVKEVEPTSLGLRGSDVALRTFIMTNLGEPPEKMRVLSGSTMPVDRMIRQFRHEPGWVNWHFGNGFTPLPYTLLFEDRGRFVGDLTTKEGQRIFLDSDVVLETDEQEIVPWALQLWKFIRDKRNPQLTVNEKQLGLRGIAMKQGRLVFTVGPHPYLDKNLSVDSSFDPLDLSNLSDRRKSELQADPEAGIALEAEGKRLRSNFLGAKTVFDAVMQKTGGRLPGFEDHIVYHTLGVAGTVLTADGHYVFVNRNPKGVDINIGIAPTASGSVKGDELHLNMIRSRGIPEFVSHQMAEEMEEEVNIKGGSLFMGALEERVRQELNIGPDQYEMVPLALVRELTRFGAPQAIFGIRYPGKLQDVLRRITENPDVYGRHENDAKVFALPRERAHELVRHPDACNALLHKTVLNVLLMEKYMATHGA